MQEEICRLRTSNQLQKHSSESTISIENFRENNKVIFIPFYVKYVINYHVEFHENDSVRTMVPIKTRYKCREMNVGHNCISINSKIEASIGYRL